MKIVVLGYIVRGPLGGLCWHYLQYIIGLQQSGHDVLYLEDSDNFASCYNPKKFETSKDPSYGLRFISQLFRSHGIGGKWAYYDEHTDTWHGRSYASVRSFCHQADMVINISNVNPLRSWWSDIPVRILVDTDPAFTQIRHLVSPRDRAIAAAHTHFFTFGENYGQPGCKIPKDGFDWKPTRQPVVLKLWKKTQAPRNAAWTTVMQWDSYVARKYKGKRYGMKSASFHSYFSLPKYTGENLELAVGGRTAPLEKLTSVGWHVADPLAITRTANNYQDYICGSKGEFSIAKHGYVVSKSGWFSERSAVYLASGRPVIAQDTGFSQIIETGRGLISFQNKNEALEALDEMQHNYRFHVDHARKIAATYFESHLVLTSLLATIS